MEIGHLFHTGMGVGQGWVIQKPNGLLGMNAKIYWTMPYAKLKMATILKYLLFLVCLAASRVSVALKKGLAVQLLI